MTLMTIAKVAERFRAVILVCAGAEWRALVETLPPGETRETPFGSALVRSFDLAEFGEVECFLLHTGWGKIDAASAAQYAIDAFHPKLVVNLGTCGGIEGCIRTGTVLLVERTIVYDIEEAMGDPEAALAAYETELDLSWVPHPPPSPVRKAPMATADRDLRPRDLAFLKSKYGAVAADWESGAIARVASRNGIRCLILRGVSDLVHADGGEAYGKLELFAERAATVMHDLAAVVPLWLAAALQDPGSPLPEKK